MESTTAEKYDKESMSETLSIMANKDMMEDIRLGDMDVEMGRLVPWEKVLYPQR